jgi:hypothetical protein
MDNRQYNFPLDVLAKAIIFTHLSVEFELMNLLLFAFLQLLSGIARGEIF